MSYYQTDMLSIKSHDILSNYLTNLLLLSQSIQTYREQLAKIPYFDCIGLFRFIDEDQKGYIREKDFMRIMGTKHRKLVTYAFSWLDNLKVGEISRLEFAAFLLPKDDLGLREDVAQRLQAPEIAHSQMQTMSHQFAIFQQMLQTICNAQLKLIEQRYQLLSQPGYSINGILLALDVNRHNFVTSQDIEKLLKNYGKDASKKSILKLVEIINSDISGKINKNQLKWIIEGLESKDKEYLNKVKKANKKKPPQKQNVHQINPKQLQKMLKDVDSEEVSEINQHYRLLMEKYQLVEQEARNTDQDLVKLEQQVLTDNQKLFKKELANIKLKNELDAVKMVQQQEQSLIRTNMHGEIDNLIAKSQQIQSESQKIMRIQNKYDRQLDRHIIKQQMLSIPTTPHSSYYQPRIQPYISSSRRSDRDRILIQEHIDNSEDYLEQARNLREKIQKEREIQRSIRQKLQNYDYYKQSSYNRDSRRSSPRYNYNVNLYDESGNTSFGLNQSKYAQRYNPSSSQYNSIKSRPIGTISRTAEKPIYEYPGNYGQEYSGSKDDQKSSYKDYQGSRQKNEQTSSNKDNQKEYLSPQRRRYQQTATKNTISTNKMWS